jgi:hypothetical protein
LAADVGTSGGELGSSAMVGNRPTLWDSSLPWRRGTRQGSTQAGGGSQHRERQDLAGVSMDRSPLVKTGTKGFRFNISIPDIFFSMRKAPQSMFSTQPCPSRYPPIDRCASSCAPRAIATTHCSERRPPGRVNRRGGSTDRYKGSSKCWKTYGEGPGKGENMAWRQKRQSDKVCSYGFPFLPNRREERLGGNIGS